MKQKAFLLVPIALGIYTLIDSAFVRVYSNQRLIYASLWAVILFAILIHKQEQRDSRKIFMVAVAWITWNMVYLLPVFTQRVFYPSYVVGDFASLTLPALFLILASRKPDIFNEQVFSILMFIMIIASFLGPLTVESGLNRWEPPHLLLLTLIWVYTLSSNIPQKKFWGILLLIGLGSLAFLSNQRTNIILWPIAGFFTILWWQSWKTIAILGYFCIVIFLSLLLFGNGVIETINLNINQIIRESRFSKLEDGVDDSIMVRLTEAQDILYTIETEWDTFNYIFGAGHGATFFPIISQPNLRLITSNGSVHNIHIGFFMILYRYGITGIVIYFGIFLMALFDIIGIILNRRKSSPNKIHFVITLSTILIIFNSFLRNVFVDPLTSFILAGFIFYKLQARYQKSVGKQKIPMRTSPNLLYNSSGA